MPHVRAPSLPRAQELVNYVATNEDLRPSHGPAHAGSLWLRVILSAVAVTVALTSSLGIRQNGDRPEFLADKLGSAAAAFHVTAAGDAVAITRSGYELRAGGRRVAISSADESGTQWERYERGAVRTTPFGEETVVVDGNVVEQFLTVTEPTTGTRSSTTTRGSPTSSSTTTSARRR